MRKIAFFLCAAMLMSVLAVPAAAANFTPSVEQKSAPTVVTTTDSTGAEVSAIIRDANGNEVTGVPTNELIVTPYSDKDSAADTSVTAALESAYKQIQTVDTLDELNEKVVDLLTETNALLGTDVALEDLVVKDLFDASVYGTYADYLAIEGNTISITFDVGMTQGEFLMVLVSGEDGVWKTVSASNVIINADGTVTVIFDELCVVAFVVDGSEVDVDYTTTTSPQTGKNTDFPTAGMVVAGLLACAVLFVAVTMKKRTAK